MPQLFNNAVITDAGAQLLTKAQAGEIKIEFVKLVIGDGSYTESEKNLEALQARTNLKSAKNEYAFNSIHVFSEYSVKLTALITNQDPITKETLVSDGYYINEIGLYAKEKGAADNTAILYSVAITVGSNGDFMPPYNGYNPAQITQDYYVTVNNSADVTINIKSSGAAVLVEDFNEFSQEITEEIDKLKKSVSDGKSALASAITEMGVSTETDATFAEMTENVEAITPSVKGLSGSVSGSWNGTTFTYSGGAGGTVHINGNNEKPFTTVLPSKTTNVGGNAAVSDVLSGKTFSSDNAGRAVNGTMANRGAYTYDLHCLSNNGATDYSGIKLAIPAGYHNGSGYIRAHSHAGFAFCKTHTWNGYSYCTMSPNAGTYYSLDGVSESTETPLFVVLWESTVFTKVLDIVFVGDSWANRYISYTKDFSCWRNGTSVVVNKDSANKIADGTYMSAVILSFVGR